jgi:4-hydroxy-tetrahydrodipicolinate synthase
MTERILRALRGISGVHVTPYDDAGRIDTARLRDIVDRIARAGIANIVTAGNTGEFYALALDEVKTVYRAAVAGAGGRALVTAGIGRSLGEAIDLGIDAAVIGADAVMVHQPPDPFAAPRGVVQYLKTLAERLPVPVIAYIRTDTLGPAEFIELAATPNLVGVKYASSNLLRLSECMRATQGTELAWICGLAEAWAPPFYALGARGFTSGLVNVFPERSMAILAALDAGEYARAAHLIDDIAPFEALRTAEQNGTNVTIVKEALAILGCDVGPVRAPGAPRLTPAQRQSLERIVTEWGLRPW